MVSRRIETGAGCADPGARRVGRDLDRNPADVRSPSSVHIAFEADGREEEIENADLDLIQEKLNFLRGRL